MRRRTFNDEAHMIRSGSEAMHEKSSPEKTIRMTPSLEKNLNSLSSEKGTPSEQSMIFLMKDNMRDMLNSSTRKKTWTRIEGTR